LRSFQLVVPLADVTAIPLGLVVVFLVVGVGAIVGLFRLAERWLDRH
jgi:hypothetical protein